MTLTWTIASRSLVCMALVRIKALYSSNANVFLDTGGIKRVPLTL